jgi:hypothetical protein
MSRVRYASTADRPALALWLFDDDGDLIDFASGYTFSLKVGRPGSTAALTKSAGITGAAGAGTEPDGTPNVTITWSAGELAFEPGSYTAQLTATTSSLDRVFQFPFDVVDVVL